MLSNKTVHIGKTSYHYIYQIMSNYALRRVIISNNLPKIPFVALVLFGMLVTNMFFRALIDGLMKYSPPRGATNSCDGKVSEAVTFCGSIPLIVLGSLTFCPIYTVVPSTGKTPVGHCGTPRSSSPLEMQCLTTGTGEKKPKQFNHSLRKHRQ